MHLFVADIRKELKNLFQQKKLAENGTIEIIAASFLADEPAIFGTVNEDYVKREIEWYDSFSLNVNDIKGKIPQLWQEVADKDGFINSNYGWCVYHPDNYSQFESAVAELKANPASRRALMIYTRPSMWRDYNLNGRSDFCCTDGVQYFIREGAVHAHVRMRSNDAVYGYKNDFAWQQVMLKRVVNELGQYDVGKIHWTAGSLHVYPKHFKFLE